MTLQSIEDNEKKRLKTRLDEAFLYKNAKEFKIEKKIIIY